MMKNMLNYKIVLIVDIRALHIYSKQKKHSNVNRDNF